MDRILSPQEIINLIPLANSRDYSEFDFHRAITKAQLAKTDDEWAEWVEQPCPHEPQEILCGPDNSYYEERKFDCKSECPLCWRERRKEIGL